MQSPSKATRHTERIGVSSGFCLHYRHPGVNQEKMDRMIQQFFRENADLLRRPMAAGDFDALMGAKAIAAGDYLPDRLQSLAGAAAYQREKKKYMKDFGLARADALITNRMYQYIKILETGGDKIGFLQEQALKMKLMCPQIANKNWTPKQNGYKHYRIRPTVMFLYAIKQAQTREVGANTDDIALSAFRFFTPREQALVDEAFLMRHIDAYFNRKAKTGIDYEQEFRALMTRVERDLRYSLTSMDIQAFARKCRNAGNEIFCTIIFLRQLRLVDAPKIQPTGWSCTQQRYEDTPPVPEFNVLNLTAEGERALMDALSMVPVWHTDLVEVFGAECFREIEFVNHLSNGQQISAGDITDEQVNGLSEVDLVLLRKAGVYHAERVPVFELQYDMP